MPTVYTVKPVGGNTFFYTIDIQHTSVRYFNGRRYNVTQTLEHYVFPGQNRPGFSQHTTQVHVARKATNWGYYHDYSPTRFSRVQYR